MGKQRVEKPLNFENFELKKMWRSEIKAAPYNPRVIDEEAKKNLKKFLKEYGLLFPAVVLNKRTGNQVGGHKRLEMLDVLAGGKPYELTVSVVDLTEKKEIEACIKLNNENMMGKFSPELLLDIKQEYGFDLVKDLSFKQEEIDLMFAGLDIQITEAFKQDSEVYTEYQEANKEQLKATKDRYKAGITEKNKNGETIYGKDDDYSVTFVFRNNTEKARFMKQIHQPAGEKIISADLLFKINKEYPISKEVKNVKTKE